MERLTQKSPVTNMVWFIDHEKNDTLLEPCEMNSHHNRLAIKKLNEYEKAEEQGLLLKTPCKIGNTVFRINNGTKNPIIPMVISEIRYKALRSGKVIMKIMGSDDIMTKADGCSVYYEEEIGKKIFLTKEEAEKALAELSWTLVEVTGITRGKEYEVVKVEEFGDCEDITIIDDNGNEQSFGSFFFCNIN